MESIRRYAMFIGGDWAEADERFEIRSPATEELVASVAKGGREHTDRAVAAAKAAHDEGGWRRTPPEQRAAVLDAIADRVGELAVLEALENGAPVRQAGAFQIGFSVAHLRYFAGQARSYAFERSGPLLKVPTLATGLVRREPVGVCAAIVPWNFPLLLAMWKIGPALAAGNTMPTAEAGRPAGPRFDRGFWVEPTIFTNVRNDMTIAREEIFGPVLAVIRSESTEQAIRIANDTEYGLSAGVWSADNQRALGVARQLEAGTVWVNDWHMVNAAYPFGGYKQSGLGCELGPHAFDEYTEEKFVHVDLSGRLDRRAYALLLGTPPA
jgi:acyl-CoA reductase-like NAD-dependent aldehyde dehydrogenase